MLVAVETRRAVSGWAAAGAHPRLHRARRRRARTSGCGASGYLPDDLIGKAGIEATFEDELRGTYGTELVERDATGRDIQVLRTVQPAVPGASLRLTIDRTIQKEATQALKWGMKAAGLKRGVFIVMNPQTGEVLALVSLPVVRQQRVRARDLGQGVREAREEQEQAAHQPRGAGPLPARLDVQARRRDRRARGPQDHAEDAHPDRRLPDARRHPVLRLEPHGLRHVQHLLRVRALVGHVLLPDRGDARRRPARLLGAPVRLRQADRDRPAGRGRRDRAVQPVEGRRARASG